MKKFLIISIIILIACMMLSAGIRSDVGVSEEFSYSRFNHSPYMSSEEFPNRFRTSSVMLDSKLSQYLLFVFSDSIGLNMQSCFGYSFSIFDINRFASIPDSLNGSIALGPMFTIGKHSLCLSFGLKSSLFLENKYWISQIGAIGSYMFDAEYFSVSLLISYWYNTNYRTLTVGLGIQFGD